MAARWEFRGGLLVVPESGVATNGALEPAFVGEALADARFRPGTPVRWDARESQTPLTAHDVAWLAG